MTYRSSSVWTTEGTRILKVMGVVNVTVRCEWKLISSESWFKFTKIKGSRLSYASSSMFKALSKMAAPRKFPVFVYPVYSTSICCFPKKWFEFFIFCAVGIAVSSGQAISGQPPDVRLLVFSFLKWKIFSKSERTISKSCSLVALRWSESELNVNFVIAQYGKVLRVRVHNCSQLNNLWLNNAFWTCQIHLGSADPFQKLLVLRRHFDIKLVS